MMPFLADIASFIVCATFPNVVVFLMKLDCKNRSITRGVFRNPADSAMSYTLTAQKEIVLIRGANQLNLFGMLNRGANQAN